MGRCVVCGLAATMEDEAVDGFCRATCVREAETELLLVVGRLHQLDRLRLWRERATAWQLLLHPTQRREADDAQAQRAELEARRTVLDRALRRWAIARQRDEQVDPLGPRGATSVADGPGTSVVHPRPRPVTPPVSTRR